MTELLIIFGLIYISIIVLVLVLIRHYYLKGQLKGWQDCKNFVINRAKENHRYNYETVVEDLLQ